MKVINLDKFKNSQTVEFDGAKYTVNGVSVDMYLNNTQFNELDNAASPEDRIRIIIDLLTKLSDIPEDVLKKQGMGMLSALMQVAQGIDPTEEGAVPTGDKKNPNV